MANETEMRWAERVAAWEASGQTSAQYCEGRDFTAGGLRHWAYRLRKAGLKATALARRPEVHLVRVERAPAVLAAPAAAVSSAAPLTIELGGARVAVPAGFDATTLRTTLETLIAAIGGRS